MDPKTMMKRLTVLILSAAAVFAADDLPSAASLLDRYVEVTGGRQAYENRKSEITRGTMEYAAQGLKGAIVRYAAVPDLYYATLEIPGLGAIQMGVKDGVAWERSDILGPRIKTGAERAESLREAMLNSSLEWRKLYPKVETTGVAQVNGEECYTVVMTPAEGHPQTMYLSKSSGLGLKVTTIAVTQMGEVPVEILVSEFKKFGDLLAPSRITQKAVGQQFTITIESVEVNPEIPAGRFDFPADVQALLEKQKAVR
jgi:hypothetical protein